LIHPLNADELLVPTLLPEKRPTTWKELPLGEGGRTTLERRYEIEFTPTGFFCRLLVRLLQLGWQPFVFYRYGFQLHRDNVVSFQLEVDTSDGCNRVTTTMFTTKDHFTPHMVRSSPLLFFGLLLFSSNSDGVCLYWVRL
jgi:hypothetical protein